MLGCKTVTGWGPRGTVPKKKKKKKRCVKFVLVTGVTGAPLPAGPGPRGEVTHIHGGAQSRHDCVYGVVQPGGQPGSLLEKGGNRPAPSQPQRHQTSVKLPPPDSV